MGRKSKTAGLTLRGGIWHIEKRLKEAPGGRLRESTGTGNLTLLAQRLLPEAQRYLTK